MTRSSPWTASATSTPDLTLTGSTVHADNYTDTTYTNLAALDSTANTKLGTIATSATNNNVYNGSTTLRGNTTGTAGDFFFDETLNELYVWE